MGAAGSAWAGRKVAITHSQHTHMKQKKQGSWIGSDVEIMHRSVGVGKRAERKCQGDPSAWDPTQPMLNCPSVDPDQTVERSS